MKKLGCLLLMLLSNFIIAQAKYEKGYFVDNSGQKTECLIKNEDWRDNPTYFYYKSSLEEKEKANNIKSVKEFAVEGQNKFERYEVLLDTSEVNLDRLTEIRNPEWKKKTLYLKVIVDGDPKLYEYVEGNKRKYFFTTKDKKVEQLVYKEYLERGGITILKNKLYQQQLLNDARCEDEKIKRKISFLNYKYDDLVKYFLEVNNCNGNKIVEIQEINKKRKAVNIKVKTGINFTSVETTNIESSKNEKVDFGKKALFRIGAELEYLLPFRNSKFTLFIEPSYQAGYKSDCVIYNEYAPGYYHTYKLDVIYKTFDVAGGVRYNYFLSGNSKIFLNLGVSHSQLIEGRIKFDSGRELDLNTPLKLFFGAGFTYKKLLIETRFINSSNIGDSHPDAKFRSFGLAVGYTIF